MLVTIDSTSATESTKYLRAWPSPQENIIEPKKLYTQHPLWQGWTVPMKLVSEEALFYDDLGNLIPYEYPHLQRSADVMFRIETALSWLLSKRITIPQPAEVRDYLIRYPDMTDRLLPVCEATHYRFGPQAQLSLEVYHDPEIEDKYLTLYVRQQKYDESVMKGIKEIRGNYERMLIGGTGWLLVTTDFRPPR